jgi:predicted membrane protein (TIGR00267 family)
MVKKEVKRTIKQWKRYHKISDVSKITRRYFVMNAFDGALTMLGVIIGAAVGGVLEPRIIITAAVAGSIAMGASGMSGAYMTERAERTKKLKKLEKAMLTDLRDGLHYKSHRFASIFAALVDGLSPAIAALIVVFPFFLSNFRIIADEIAFYSSIAITLILLTSLGIYLAKISEESMLRYGIQMLLVGLLTAFICVGTSILLGGSVPA